MPADLRLKALAARVEEERNHALERKEEREPDERDRTESEGAAFEALSSSAYLDDALTSTAHGDDLALFYEEPPAPAPAAAPAGSRRAAGSALAEPETAYERRERLRERRARLVADLSRLTREGHATIHARVNAATGARSVGTATADQLERANELLLRELRRAA